MSKIHPKTQALLFAASAHRPTGGDWRSDPLERAVGEWVEAGSPDIQWECARRDASGIADLHNHYRLGSYPAQDEE